MNGFNMAFFIAADGLGNENYQLVKTRGLLSGVLLAGLVLGETLTVFTIAVAGPIIAGMLYAEKRSAPQTAIYPS